MDKPRLTIKPSGVTLFIVTGITGIILLNYLDLHFFLDNDFFNGSLGWTSIVQEQIRSGDLPLYNKYAMYGTPLLFKGSASELLLMPFLYFVSSKSFLIMVSFAYFLFGLLFMYKLLSLLEYPKYISAAGSVVWNFSGMIVHYLHVIPMSTVLLFLPLILFSITKIIHKDRLSLHWPLLIFTNSFVLLTSRWGYVEFTAWIVILYIVFGVAQKKNLKPFRFAKRIRHLAIYGISMVLGFLIISPYSVNLLDMLANSGRGGGIDVIFSSTGDLLATIIPNGYFRVHQPLMFYFSISPLVLPFIFIKKEGSSNRRLFGFTLISIYLILCYQPIGLWRVLAFLLPLHDGYNQLSRL